MSVALLISLSTTATRRDAVDMGACRLLKCARIGNRIPASFSIRAKNSGLLLHPGEKAVDVADEVIAPHVEGIETGLWSLLNLKRPLLSGGVPCSESSAFGMR